MIAKFDKKARSGTGKGLKKYLENGTKNDRDKKDTRVTLLGDIDILQSAIKLGHNKGYKETYRNIVVSFNEDEVSQRDLQKIAQTYIEQYTKGYESDEIVSYGEAHIPNIKYKMKYNKATKEFEKIKRKPHIHLSIALYSPKLDKKLILNSNDKRIYDINLLTRKLEYKYGFEPVKPKAISNDITQVQSTSKTLNKRKNIKDSIDKYLCEYIDQIKNYDELKKRLQNTFNIEIIRESTFKAKTKSITILYDNKKIRLKGDIFHHATFDKVREELLSNSNTNREEIKQVDSKYVLEKINQQLQEFNQKKITYINQQNEYARRKAQKRIEYYNFQEIQQIKNRFKNYQSKIYYEIYGRSINYNLNGFYIKQYEKQPNKITLITNKEKQIKVIDRGTEITLEGDNLKEEVKISIELCLAKGWELEDIESNGSEEFIKESKRQINILIKSRNQNIERSQEKYRLVNSTDKSKTIIEQEHFKIKNNISIQNKNIDNEEVSSKKDIGVKNKIKM
jgi:hypothetical protein